MGKRHVIRRSHAEVVIAELDAIAVQIGERIVQCSASASQLTFLGREDLAAPLQSEITSLVYVRKFVDKRITDIQEGATV